MKKVIKENKVLFALALVIFISLIVIVIGLITYFYSTDGDKYGSRLKDIDKYPISKNIDEEIKSLYESGVQDVKVNIHGKIIYIIMDVSDGASKWYARSLAEKALEKFSDEEKSYYDIQFMITCKTATEETTDYPQEGLKSSKNNHVVWTNN